LILALLVIVVIGVLFAWRVDLRAVAAQLRGARLRYLAGASMLLVSGLLLYAVNWRWLLGGRAPLTAIFHAANIGHAANILLPLRLGEAARVAALARAGAVAAGASASSVVVERLLLQVMRLGALGAAVMVGVGLPFNPLSAGVAVLFLAAAVAGVLALRKWRGPLLARLPRLVARLPRVSEARAGAVLASLLDGLDVAATPGRLAGALGLTALSWACFLGFDALVLQALPLPFSAGERMTLAFAALALAPPAAPAQPGVYHASVVAPLVLLGFAETSLTAFAVLLHALMMLWMLGLGGVGLVGLRRSGPAQRIGEEALRARP
jgi:uncharacterized membrane protein YbhN (UPF0104 family)